MLAFTVVPAFAHILVIPNQVGIATTQDFTVSVPNEKDNPVVLVRLLIPNGLTSVTPNTVPGWTIDTKTNNNNATVTEIDWSGGSIPVGQRAEFIFQAQAPAKQTTLNWKAYQTYSNGIVVSWDVNPATLKNLSDSQQDDLANKENKGVYATTSVINDLTNTKTSLTTGTNTNSVNHLKWLMLLSGAAFVLSIIAICMQMKRKN